MNEESKQLRFFQNKHNNSTTKMFPKYLFALCALVLFAAVANVNAEEDHDLSAYSAADLQEMEELPVEERNKVRLSNLLDIYIQYILYIL